MKDFVPSDFRILIVDDVPKNIQVLGNVLSKQAYQVAYAQNGETALKTLNKNSFDLVLLDVMMPGMDGFEVCKQMKTQNETANIPVIFLTAKVDTESIVRGFELGGQDYITKPFNSAELLARVRTHLKLKHAEDELRRKEQRLSELNATKDKFFSIVAHDLKNPFHTMMGFADLLIMHGDRYDLAKLNDIYKQVHAVANRGHVLLENLLEWSRAQTGRLHCEPLSFPIKSLVYENFELLENAALAKGIRFTADIPDMTFVYADMNMINTVLRNLLSNAIKFTNQDGHVQVLVRPVDDEQVAIMVIDNGVGISPENQEKLFRLDVNHSTQGTRHERGSGLGLILCKEFVERNGGTIHVLSTLGEGSQFIIHLPKGSDTE